MNRREMILGTLAAVVASQAPAVKGVGSPQEGAGLPQDPAIWELIEKTSFPCHFKLFGPAIFLQADLREAVASEGVGT